MNAKHINPIYGKLNIIDIVIKNNRKVLNFGKLN